MLHKTLGADNNRSQSQWVRNRLQQTQPVIYTFALWVCHVILVNYEKQPEEITENSLSVITDKEVKVSEVYL